MDRLEELKAKYKPVLRAMETHGIRLQNVHLQDSKLFLKGVAPSQTAKDRIWDLIKMTNPQQDDIIADITLDENAQTAAPASGPVSAAQTYTVQAGDTLSKISKQFYGDANRYMRIFEANRDKLKDPDKIQPGQQLVIPAA